MPDLTQLPLIIAGGADVSSGAPIDTNVVAVIMPDAWDAGAEITFEISLDSEQWHPFCDRTGNEITMEVTPGGAVNVSDDFARAIQYLRIRAGRPQSQERVFRVVTEKKAKTR